jgi:hypothetical protein
MKANDELATKRDVEEIVGRVVGEIVSEAMQLIAEQFVTVHRLFEKQQGEFKLIKAGLATLTARFDNQDTKLNNTVERVDSHDLQTKQLKQKIA